MEKAGAKSLCKTSGKRGLHVYVPLGARYNNNHARQFAEIIAKLALQQLPNSTSLWQRKLPEPLRVRGRNGLATPVLQEIQADPALAERRASREFAKRRMGEVSRSGSEP